MKVNLFICTLLLFLVPTCNKSSTTPAGTLIVQLLINSSVLTQMRRTMTPLINDSIKAELGLELNYEFQFFSPKERQALTIYSIEEILENGKPMILSTFEQIHAKCNELPSGKITFVCQGDFFGGPFNVNDELVIGIDDFDNSLSDLNRDVRTIVHETNKLYAQRHNHDLYTIAKSERYSYIPHIGLGRVRSNSIKEHMKDPCGFDALFNRIQERIKEVAVSVIKNMLKRDNHTILFDKVCMFDLKKRTCIKEAALNPHARQS